MGSKFIRYFSVGIFLHMVLLFTAGFAYLDPGTGSFLVQVIIAGVIAVAAAFKAYWKKVFDFFGGKRGK